MKKTTKLNLLFVCLFLSCAMIAAGIVLYKTDSDVVYQKDMNGNLQQIKQTSSKQNIGNILIVVGGVFAFLLFIFISVVILSTAKTNDK